MNLGLDPQPDGRFKLSKSDPLYGKLAFLTGMLFTGQMTVLKR